MVRKLFAVAVVSCFGLAMGTAMAADIGTAFTYQGSLENGSGPVTDTCDFRFGLWDAAAGGNQVGTSPQNVSFVDVAGGVFTVTLDFGAGAIDGSARWLAIEVQCSLDGAFVPLDSQRVALTPAPHAIRASKGVGPPNALEVDTATSNVGIGTVAPLFPLHVSTASVSGRAVYGEHTAAAGVTYGGRFESDSTDGRGVFGWATAGSGFTIGGRFESFSTDGRGVYSEATANSGTTYGGYFTSASTSGRGIYGLAVNGNGTTYGVSGQSASTDGRGVYGLATANTGLTYGGFFESESTDGRGVRGRATANSGFTIGGHFESFSTDGRGVYSEATANSGTTYGGYFSSASTSGRGVYGLATAGSGFTIGGLFESESTSGRGVYGSATAGSGFTVGGLFVSDSTDGRGVYGAASAGTGITNGVYGESVSTSGRGIYGRAFAGTGITSGVYGQSDSTDGTGVVGIALAISGTTYGVKGVTASPDGFAGYFTGPILSKNYFQRNVGIGTTAPDVMLHVDGGIDASLSDGSGSIVVGSLTSTNIVMDTNEIIARSNGFASDLFLNNGSGQVGILRNTASHPLHVGINAGNGNGAHLTAGGAWTNGSSRDFKQGFEPIDKQAVLRKVVELPVTRWQYKGEAVDVHHIGPVAQDFRAAFEVGHDERYITTIDADGVALAAIQGLHQIVLEKDCEIGEMNSEISGFKSEISNLKAEITEMRVMVKALAVQNRGGK